MRKFSITEWDKDECTLKNWQDKHCENKCKLKKCIKNYSIPEMERKKVLRCKLYEELLLERLKEDD